MIKVSITPMWRGTKGHATQRKVQHCVIDAGKVQAHAIGSSEAEARAKARKLLGVRVHALSKHEALSRVPYSIGLPDHYRLAREAGDAS